LCFLPLSAWAQGFSGLGTDADAFTAPTAGKAFIFPEDHGPHADYRIEWWYLTANLKGPNGTAYGLQWTLFRTALSPQDAKGWQSPQVWFAHAAVTTPDQHFVTERFARGGIGQAGVQASPFRAWIDEWALQGPDFDTLSLSAAGPDFRYDMQLVSNGPLVFHGDQGFSVKSKEGQASYYYSQPFFRIEGVLELPSGEIPVSGEAWLDREWSSQPLSENQSGWDWFSLSFEDGNKMMGFQLRQTDDTTYSAATWIASDGKTVSYPDGAFAAEPLVTTPVKGRVIPTSWRVTMPDRNIDITVMAINPDAWMDVSIPYWEGPVEIEGSHDGVGYLEMTGYQ